MFHMLEEEEVRAKGRKRLVSEHPLEEIKLGHFRLTSSTHLHLSPVQTLSLNTRISFVLSQRQLILSGEKNGEGRNKEQRDPTAPLAEEMVGQLSNAGFDPGSSHVRGERQGKCERTV